LPLNYAAADGLNKVAFLLLRLLPVLMHAKEIKGGTYNGFAIPAR
jgi:hypothetical protein